MLLEIFTDVVFAPVLVIPVTAVTVPEVAHPPSGLLNIVKVAPVAALLIPTIAAVAPVVEVRTPALDKLAPDNVYPVLILSTFAVPISLLLMLNIPAAPAT